jgi:hypothetical protein
VPKALGMITVLTCPTISIDIFGSMGTRSQIRDAVDFVTDDLAAFLPRSWRRALD